jgi:hypothetical protein
VPLAERAPDPIERFFVIGRRRGEQLVIAGRIGLLQQPEGRRGGVVREIHGSVRSVIRVQATSLQKNAGSTKEKAAHVRGFPFVDRADLEGLRA